MRTAFLVLAGATMLAGCNREPAVDVRNASAAEVAEAVRDAPAADLTIRPGKWQTRVTVDEMVIPGMPPGMADQMKSAMAQRENIVADHCVTPEDAKRPDGKLFTGKASGNCRYDHFTMRGGKIDALMRCSGPGGGDMTVKWVGTYAAESSSTKSETNLAAGPGRTMTIKAHTETRRVGDCDAKAA